jgi:hypothetical protein
MFGGLSNPVSTAQSVWHLDARRLSLLSSPLGVLRASYEEPRKSLRHDLSAATARAGVHAGHAGCSRERENEEEQFTGCRMGYSRPFQSLAKVRNRLREETGDRQSALP